MDQMSEYLEELVLDAVLAVIKKIRERNILFDELSNKNEIEDDKLNECVCIINKGDG